MKQTILLALLIITGTSAFAQKGVDLGLSVEWADCNLGGQQNAQSLETIISGEKNTSIAIFLEHH